MHMEVLRAGTGDSVRLTAGDTVEIRNPSGSQVIDTWALVLPGGAEFLSVEHTRAILGNLVPGVGDTLFSDRREPLLTMTEDTSPGVHDMLIPACDRYRMPGAPEHANCHDIFLSAAAAAGVTPSRVPNPLNLFMNVPVHADGSVVFDAPRSAPGDRVLLRAERDLLAVMSACPQDLVPVNGHDHQPADIHYRVIAPAQPC